MKCRYRFSVIGRFILDVSVPIPTNSWIVEFYPRSGRITHIDITVPISREEWPRITPNPTPGVKLEIETNADRLPWIQRELRSLQGLLAVFGFHTIELDNPSLKWIPETEEESTALKLASLSTRRSPLADDQIPPISFDLVARAVMACDAATDIELPLNFFRRGMLDFNDRQFIESFYDFFFVIENQYAEGQFRKAAVLDAFMRSAALCAFTDAAISQSEKTFIHDKQVQEAFANSYARMTVEQALERIVDLRGQLHHQMPKRRDNWHPEDQARYEVDALFLQAICHKVVFSLAERYIWDPQVVRDYEALAIAFGNEPHLD